MAKKIYVNPETVGGGIYLVDGTVLNFIADLPDGGKSVFKSLCDGLNVIFINNENGAIFSPALTEFTSEYIEFSVNFPIHEEIIDDAILEHCTKMNFIMTGDTATGQYDSVEVEDSYAYIRRFDLQ